MQSVKLTEKPHLPTFDRSISASMSERQLLGLPETYTRARQAYHAPVFKKLAPKPVADLLEVIGAADSPFADRFAAGHLLGIYGDPRIKPLDPPMCDIAGDTVSIGLSASDLDSVMSDLTGLGISVSWIEKEIPRHTVQLSPYRIGAFPVTNAEYHLFLEDVPTAPLPSTWSFGHYPQGAANQPVHSVSAEAAEQYCSWLGARTRRNFRLPSEAEWEFAAAGHSGAEYPWGPHWLPDRANTAEEAIFTATPIGCFPKGRSWCGAYDMAGNIEEFVSEAYRPYPNGREISDDLGSVEQAYRVARGGSFTRFRDLARSRRRHGHFPSAIYVMGFRLAETHSFQIGMNGND